MSNIKTYFDNILTEALHELEYNDVKHVVAVVQNGDSWLLGLSSARDDREHKWCFPGGHLERNEDIKQAAERETKEETHVRCHALKRTVILPNKKHVIFVHCKANKSDTIRPNKEFISVGWFTERQMKGLKLHHNVLTIIDIIKRKRA